MCFAWCGSSEAESEGPKRSVEPPIKDVRRVERFSLSIVFLGAGLPQRPIARSRNGRRSRQMPGSPVESAGFPNLQRGLLLGSGSAGYGLIRRNWLANGARPNIRSHVVAAGEEGQRVGVTLEGQSGVIVLATGCRGEREE